MYKTAKKEQFSVAYMKALAAPLGYNPDSYDVDDDSVDIFFKAKGYEGKRIRNPQLHFQLKCTHRTFNENGILKFPLPIKNYIDLRGDDVVSPTYLIVLNVPINESDWLTCNEEDLILRHSAYWISLKDNPEVNNTTSITIDITKEHKFDSMIFKMLMDKASEGISL